MPMPDLQPFSLPASGKIARDFALDYVFGADAAKAWVTEVKDISDRHQWHGARAASVVFHDDGTHAHYFNGTTIDGPRRTDEYSTAGVVLLLDDIGLHLDRDFFETFAPTPTLLVETSPGNVQAQYVFEPRCTAEELKAFKKALKATPWGGGVKDASGAVQYMRLPSGVNVKPDKFGFETRLLAKGPKYKLAQLMAALGVRSLAVSTTALTAPASPGGIVETCSEAEARAWLDIMGNGDFFDDRDIWISVAAALMGALGPAVGREPWLDWCAKRPQAPGEPERVWDTMHDPKIGASALRFWAKQINPEAAAKLAFGLGQDTGNLVDSPGDSHGKTREAALDKVPVQDVLAVANAPGALPPPDPNHLHKLPLTILPGLDRGEVTVFGGKSSSFKSLYAVLVATAITEENHALVGSPDAVDWPGDVILLSNEDPESVVRRRLDACRQVNGIAAMKLTHDILVWDVLPFVRDEKTKAIGLNSAFADRLAKHLGSGRAVAAIVVDTLTGAVAGGNEESNYEFQTLVVSAKALAQKITAAVVIIHHARKGGTGDDRAVAVDYMAVESLRGGSTLGNTPRNITMLGKPTKEDQKRYGFSEDDMKTLTVAAMRKRSHGALLDDVWFRRVAVDVRCEDVRRAGVVVMRSEVALKLEGPLVAMAARAETWRAALGRLVEAEKAGQRVRVYARRGVGTGDSIEDVLGMDSDTARTVVGVLTGMGVVIPREDAKARKTYLEVTARGLEAIAEKQPEEPF